jgi:hypothetical protein
MFGRGVAVTEAAPREERHMNMELRVGSSEERELVSKALEPLAQRVGNLTVSEAPDSADLLFAFDDSAGIHREGRLLAEHRMGTE